MEDSKKFLIFSIFTEQYAIPIKKIIEIMRYEKITPMMNGENYFKGVINLRGKIIPIVDMRSKFGMNQEDDFKDRTVFIIVEMISENGSYNVGISVDSVHEVININESEISEAPKVGLKLKDQYIEGIAKINDKIAMILDINRILTNQEIINLQEAVS
jgi:purine-binding chemotaxis protein CheW